MTDRVLQKEEKMIKIIKLGTERYFSNYRGIPGECWVDIFFNLLNAISVGVCFFLSLYFASVLQLNIFIVGMLMSCYGMGTVVGGIVSGKLSDRISPYFISMISLFFQSMGFFLLTQFHTVRILITILFILGISTYGFKTSNNISMLNHCNGDKKLRLKTMNITYAASNLGLGISGIIIGWLAFGNYDFIFYLASAALFLSALYKLFFNKYSTFYAKPDSGDTEIVINDSCRKTDNTKIFALTLFSVFFVGLIIAQLSSTYPIYVKNSFPHLGDKAVSILFIQDTVLIVLFQASLSNYISRFNEILVMGIRAFMMGLGMIILSFSFTFTVAMISCVIWTTGEMLFIPTAQLICYENSNKKNKGQNMGVFQSTYAISTVIGPTIGGYTYSTIGANTMWYLSLIIGTLCLFSCLTLVKNTKTVFA